MSIFSDFHTHTSFSADSDAAAEDMLLTAIKLGMTDYCITDHQDFDYPFENLVFEVDQIKYFNELTALKEKYADKINLHIGIEIGMETHLTDKLKKYAASAPFEFIIGSMHLLDRYDPYYSDFWNGKDEKAVFRRFFESTLENIKAFDGFDVLGHIDYIVRYAPSKNEKFSYSAYSDILDEILKEIISKGKGIEANSSGFRRGLENPNPHIDILKRYKELGGEIITTGSDAHNPSDVGADFARVAEALTTVGFKYYTIFNNRKPEFIKI